MTKVFLLNKNNNKLKAVAEISSFSEVGTTVLKCLIKTDFNMRDPFTFSQSPQLRVSNIYIRNRADVMTMRNPLYG